MKSIIIIALSFTLFVGCSISKKTTSSVQKPSDTKIIKSSNGIYEPDSAELKAIQILLVHILLSFLFDIDLIANLSL